MIHKFTLVQFLLTFLNMRTCGLAQPRRNSADDVERESSLLLNSKACKKWGKLTSFVVTLVRAVRALSPISSRRISDFT